MSIRAGQILHDAQGFVVDRIQTGGVSSLNIPEEQVRELGNFRTVARVRDIPDLSFDIESLDMTTEIESIVLHKDPTAAADGDQFDFDSSVPTDIISPFRSNQNAFDIVRGIGIPSLSLETVLYRFGVRQNATQTFTLRGDSVFYIPGTPYYTEYSFTGAGPYALTHTAIAYNDRGTDIFALSVCWHNAVSNLYGRLSHGDDYTDTSGNFTLTTAGAAKVPSGSKLKVIYGSLVAANYLQSVSQDATVKPAAIRAKDIDVYVGTNDATPTFSRWTSVQNFQAQRRVNLDNDEEFGNPHYVSQDYDTADVTGSIGVKPRTPAELWDKIAQIADTPGNEVVGPFTSVLLPLEMRVNHPDTGARLKTIYIPDARFEIPNVQGRVQQKTEVTFNYVSDAGLMYVYKGERP